MSWCWCCIAKQRQKVTNGVDKKALKKNINQKREDRRE